MSDSSSITNVVENVEPDNLKIDDSENIETKLDDDYEDEEVINGKIQDLEAQRNSLTNPLELALNTGINNDLLMQMAEKLKTMPRNKILEMVNQLAQANQLPDHLFSNFNPSPSSIKSNSEKISKKIKELKAKRTKAFGKSGKHVENPVNVGTVLNSVEMPSIDKIEESVQSEENSESNTLEKKKLTKSQKNRIRKKNAKAKREQALTVSEDSNMVSSESHNDSEMENKS